MKTFEVKTPWATTPDCTLAVSRYANNDHIAISIWCEDGPFADLTVNLPDVKRYPKNFGYVDTNNFPQGVQLIMRLGIGKLTGTYASSGYCSYPLCEFNEAAVHDYTA